MKANNFIERSIVGTLAFLREAIFSQEIALQNGFLQSLDPRVKITGFLLLLLKTLIACDLHTLFFLYGICLLLVLISKVGPGFFLLRTWVFIPLFSLCIGLPALFGPGDPLWSGYFLGIKLVISSQGLFGALIFVMRVLTCVSFVVLLNITTRHFELLKVLRIFKVPQIFVMTLGMSYRYIFLFIEIIQNTYLGIKSRVGSVICYRPGQRLVAWNIVSLWNYSLLLNQEVYKAMLSRGYRGEDLAWSDFRARGRDLGWLAAVILILWII